MKNLLIILLLSSFTFVIYSQEFISKTCIDLNTDNLNDSVIVQNSKNSYEFALKINDEIVLGKFDDGHANGFIIIDIDKRDNYKEVAVHTPGPSNDDEYMIYFYDGKNIIFISHLSRWPTFLGNGIVYVNNWEGFWSSRDKYIFDDSTRTLNRVEQYAYYVGKKITIGKGFEIYKEKELINKVALLSDNSEIEIILCDKENKDYFEYRYLIKSEYNLLGWAKSKTIFQNTKIPMAD